VISYRVVLDVPSRLGLFMSGVLGERRREIGTPERDRGAVVLAAGSVCAGLVPEPARMWRGLRRKHPGSEIRRLLR
jgi:hypothetical protein